MTVFYSGLSITIFATGIQLVTECRLAGPEFEMSYDSFGSKAALIGLRLPLANYIIESGCLNLNFSGLLRFLTEMLWS